MQLQLSVDYHIIKIIIIIDLHSAVDRRTQILQRRRIIVDRTVMDITWWKWLMERTFKVIAHASILICLLLVPAKINLRIPCDGIDDRDDMESWRLLHGAAFLVYRDAWQENNKFTNNHVYCQTGALRASVSNARSLKCILSLYWQ